MKSAFTTLAAIALFVSGALAQLTINTPTNVVVCQPILLTWTGGTPPYFLSILPGNQPSAAALVDLGQQTGTSVTWTVNVEAGTSLGLNLRDSSGQTAQSAPFNVNSGPDTGCVGKPPSSSAGGASTPASGSGSSGGSTPATTPASTPATTPATKPATTTAPAATSKPAATSGASSPASAASASASKNAAPSQVAQMGAAGFVGAAVMALLA